MKILVKVFHKSLWDAPVEMAAECCLRPLHDLAHVLIKCSWRGLGGIAVAIALSPMWYPSMATVDCI